jgi:hypothetical protein
VTRNLQRITDDVKRGNVLPRGRSETARYRRRTVLRRATSVLEPHLSPEEPNGASVSGKRLH